MDKITINYSFIDYCEDEDDPESIEVRTIFVSPYERREGVATQLLEELKKVANGKRITTYSSTDPLKEVFGKFLVASGFVRTTGATNYGDCWELINYAKPTGVENKNGVDNILGDKKSPTPRKRTKVNKKKTK